MKNRIILILVLISFLGFGQQKYNVKQKGNIKYNKRTKIATFYTNDKRVIKTIDFNTKTPIKDAIINLKITNDYLLVSFYKLTEGTSGVSQMFIYSNKGEKIKELPLKNNWSYNSPVVTKDFNLLVYRLDIDDYSYNVIYDLKNDSIYAKEYSEKGIYYSENVIITSYVDTTVLYFSDFIFKKIIRKGLHYDLKVYDSYVEEKVTKKKFYYKDLEDYVPEN